MNKELVLREHLAVERTKLGNERMLLAYIRTGLYFLVAGSALGELIETRFWNVMDVPIILVGLAIVLAGVFRFLRVMRVIERARHNIGEASEAFVKAARGESAAL